MVRFCHNANSWMVYFDWLEQWGLIDAATARQMIAIGAQLVD
jgi:hypothetical protein